MSQTLSRAVRSNVMLRIDMLSFPVSVHTAVSEDTDAELNNICTGAHDADAAHGPARPRQSLVCPVCEANAGFAKGRKVGDGYVIVPDDVVAAAKAGDADTRDAIDLKVHAADDLNGAMPTGKSYWLNTKASSTDSYAVLAALLTSRPDLALIGEFALRGSASLYQLVASGGTLALRQLARPDLVRERPVVSGTVDAAMLTRLGGYLDLVKSDYVAADYDAKASAAITAYIEAQTPLVPAEVAAAEGAAAPTVSLADQLSAALAAAGAPASEAESSAKPKAKKAKRTLAAVS